jgi:hypothetical protein
MAPLLPDRLENIESRGPQQLVVRDDEIERLILESRFELFAN